MNPLPSIVKYVILVLKLPVSVMFAVMLTVTTVSLLPNALCRLVKLPTLIGAAVFLFFSSLLISFLSVCLLVTLSCTVSVVVGTVSSATVGVVSVLDVSLDASNVMGVLVVSVDTSVALARPTSSASSVTSMNVLIILLNFMI